MPEGTPQKSPEQKPIKVAQILDGKGAESLEASARVYELATGDIVIAGTDKGIDYKDHNEDRVVIIPKKDFIAVVDGVGGGAGGGEKAAEILATNLSASGDISSAAEKAQREMFEAGLYKRDGAVFISGRIVAREGKKFLEVFQAGDAALVIIKKDNSISFESQDDSQVRLLVETKNITPDEALYHPRRNVVFGALFAGSKTQPKTCGMIQIDSGDLILIMSDGISDNFTAEEIAEHIKKYHLLPRQLFTWLSDTTTARMKDADEIIAKTPDRAKDGVYSDGYKSKPKPDNRALVIIEIK